MFRQKICGNCKQIKNLTDYHNSKNSSDGKTSHCKDCNIERAKKHKKHNYELILQERQEHFNKLGGNWKDVVGWENYYSVCDDGRVLSKRRMNLLVPIKKQNGYLCVSLMVDKRKIQVSLHRLVGEAFIPNPDNKREINHIDGNKENPHISNLEWVTRCENAQHAYDNALINIKKGEDCSYSKLTENDVQYIRENYVPYKVPCRIFAEKFGVSEGCINCITRNINWKK